MKYAELLSIADNWSRIQWYLGLLSIALNVGFIIGYLSVGNVSWLILINVACIIVGAALFIEGHNEVIESDPDRKPIRLRR